MVTPSIDHLSSCKCGTLVLAWGLQIIIAFNPRELVFSLLLSKSYV